MGCESERFPKVSPEKFFKRGGRRLLWGGEREHEGFDITAFELEPGQLRHGIGRERFSALLEPEFVSTGAADDWLPDEARVLVLKVGDDIRVYPRELLRRHEVVNDVVGGQPVFASYCVLADLGAVYARRVKEHTFTFAVSGYTYFDPDIWDCQNAFVLWDRDTESLWWPPIGRAVSGPMRGTRLRIFDRHAWAHTTWAEAKGQYGDVPVLADGQDFERPPSWPRFEISYQAAPRSTGHADHDVSDARWGANAELP